ncbi:trypsin-like peptidase domain-containing protein [Streptomyces sp. NPDC057638]|uniref:VMAP-C domain-containing protein n=1 Tax=Streptomyces sp. NPDC057638 TaxID=3346190 RepID=UPI00368E6B92
MPGEADDSAADAALDRAFVSVLSGDQLVGTGVLFAPGLVLTCAHVVNSALGRERFEHGAPSPRREVRLRFPRLDADRVSVGRVVPAYWRPPRRYADPAVAAPPVPGRLPYHGDLAVLALDGDSPPGALPAGFLPMWEGNEVVARWCSGHALSTVRAVPRASDRPWSALDVVGGRVAEGFSGGPLWDRERQAVVGLIVATHNTGTDPEPGTTATGSPPVPLYAIEVASVEEELSTLPPLAVPAARRGWQQFLSALEALLTSRQAVRECEERLAGYLGRRSAGPAADIERLAGLAAGARRGVPQLLDLVFEQIGASGPAGAGDWERLTRVARLVSPRVLLARQRRSDLNALLAACGETTPGALLRTVLPAADALPPVAGLADAMDVLEGFGPPPGQRMPPLLHGVIRVATAERAAGRGDLADELDAWVSRISSRLGVSREAVGQFRADVVATARPVSVPPRIQVQLFPVPPGQSFTYQIWAWNAGGPPELVLTRDTEEASEQVVADVRAVLRTHVHDHPEPALLEFFVAPAWLQLEVDTWRMPSGDDDGGFHPGISRRVVLRSSERTRDTYAGWKRRTSALPTADRLLLDQGRAEPAVSRAVLELSPETGIVVVCCPPAQRGPLLRQCVEAGVHTVLWHRSSHEAQVGTDLMTLVREVHHARIPEVVRLERATATANPGCPTHRGHWLSLLYDGPDHRPPPLAPDPWALTHP